MVITLKCCTCGATKEVEVDRDPSFGFELYDIARQAGWFPSIDTGWNRVLCFCDKDCMKKQLTKGGYMRKYLIHCEKETANS